MNPSFAGMLGFGLPELILIAAILGALLVFAAIPAVLAYLVLSRIPPPFRKQEPGMVFLLLIPFFSVIWNFFVYPRIAESLKGYYDAQGPHPHGDCGGSFALWLCICGVGAFVPLVNIAAGVGGLVLMILFFVKVFELSGRIPPPAQPAPRPGA